jgi:hypothetical protein
MSHRTRSILVLAVAAMTAAGAASRAAADAVAGPMVVVTDLPGSFRAIGALTSTDTDAPPNGIVGPLLAIPGVNWEFTIDHDVTDWRFGLPPPVADNGADDARISIGGWHLDGPHAADIDPNFLPRETSAFQDITFGGMAVLTKASREKHPIVGGGHHWDHYAVKQKARASPTVSRWARARTPARPSPTTRGRRSSGSRSRRSTC